MSETAKIINNKKQLDIPFECSLNLTKSYVDGEKWYIEGYAGSTELDLIGDIITEEAFKKSESDLLNNSTVLYNHDPEQSIGKVEETKATKEGLWIKALISQTAPEIWQKIKEGVINKFSIRGRVVDAVKRFIKEIEGKIINKVVNVINELYLVEASLVALPANPEAKALRWYISKSLQDFESKGGEIQNENDADIVFKGENMPNMTELFKQISDRLVADEDKALLESLKSEVEKGCKESLKKKSGEEWTQVEVEALEKSITDLQAEIEKQKTEKKPKKPMNEMHEDEMKEIVALADEIRKQHADKYPYPMDIAKTEVNIKKASGESYTQVEVDALVKDFSDTKARISVLEKELNDLKAEKEVEKRWNTIKNEYDEEDASVIKAIVKKSVAGAALSAEETETLVTKKLKPSELRLGGEQITTKVMTEERKKQLINLGGIKIKNNK